jgi:hypothetical protein
LLMYTVNDGAVNCLTVPLESFRDTVTSPAAR